MGGLLSVNRAVNRGLILVELLISVDLLRID